MILIGTDEAGYGPNLGPLTIAATPRRVPDGLGEIDLYDAMPDTVSREGGDMAGHIAIADSKQLYKPGGTLACLECAVHGALNVLGQPRSTWREVFTGLPPSRWYQSYDEPLPVDATDEEIRGATQSLQRALGSAHVELLYFQVAAICPAEFNCRGRALGSKGSLLTERTLQLVERVLSQCPSSDVLVCCDKHGGRNRYAAALQHVWPEGWIHIGGESRACSEYRLGVAGRDVQFRFAAGGESQLPSALASMAAKYQRELAMRAFNAYWQQHVENLRPTAGYPMDAKRFKRDIESVQRELNIDDDDLWRCK